MHHAETAAVSSVAPGPRALRIRRETPCARCAPPSPRSPRLCMALAGCRRQREPRARRRSPAAAPAPVAEDKGRSQEIVVTSTRHEESLSKVPISVTALTTEMMDVRGIKDFQDVARFTPGVQIDNSGTNNISIRGIASTGGAGTTGIYLDDTPIQMRALAFNPDEALPKSFDLDRVEVLRGPQGTLFGAGSEGGTVRYITTQPSLTATSVYSRDEVSFTQRRRAELRSGHCGRHAADRRHARHPRDRLVPTRRRLDRPHRSVFAGNCSRRTPISTRPSCCASRPCGRRRTRSRSRRASTTRIGTATTSRTTGPLFESEQQRFRRRRSDAAHRSGHLLDRLAQARG